MFQKKKILCFIDNLGSGGAQRQLVNLSTILQKAGYSVSFMVYGRNSFYLSILEENNIPVHNVFTKCKLSRILAVRKRMVAIHPDVVITFLETPGFIACVSKLLGGKWKLITTESSSKKSTFTNKRNKFFNWFECFSDAKVCNSHNARSMWEYYYPKYKRKYLVIYNPIMIDTPANEQYSYLSEGKLHMVVAASYQKLKGPLMLIEAVSQLDDSQKAKLVIDWYGRTEVTTGDTAIYNEAMTMIKKLHLDEIVRLHGETRNIYSIMSQSDVIGLFSTVEGLPNAICEGMTLGKPIIMTKVSDYSILVEGNGIVCEAFAESIRNGLAELISCDGLKLKEMGKNSKIKAKQLFSCDVIKNKWIEVIENGDN